MTDQAIKVFEFGDHGVRTAGTHDAPLFCAADVCAVLGYARASQACEGLDQDELQCIASAKKGSQRFSYTGPDANAYVTESGLFALVLRSKKPEAKAFRKWITAEVLPSIRKHGYYSMIESAARQQIEAMLAEHFPPALLPSKSRPIFTDLIMGLNALRREPRARLNPAWARGVAGFIYECALDVPGQQRHRRARNPAPGANSTDHSMFGDVALEKVNRVIDFGIVLTRSSQTWGDWKNRMRLGFHRGPMQLTLMVPLLESGPEQRP